MKLVESDVHGAMRDLVGASERVRIVFANEMAASRAIVDAVGAYGELFNFYSRLASGGPFWPEGRDPEAFMNAKNAVFESVVNARSQFVTAVNAAIRGRGLARMV